MTDAPGDKTILEVASQETGRLRTLGLEKVKTGYRSSAFGLTAFVVAASVVEVLWKGTSALLPFAMPLAAVYVGAGAWIKGKQAPAG